MQRFKYGEIHKESPSLEITTMIGCPLMCTFCPQPKLKAKYSSSNKYLKLDDLKIILSKLPRNTRIDFSGMAEPWANPSCTDFLEFVISEGFTVAIYTTLYGMDPTHAERISKLLIRNDKQVETFVLHLPDANGNMKGWRYSEEWEQTYRIISNMNLSCGVQKMTMDRTGKIHPDVPNSDAYKNEITIEFDPISRAGSLSGDQVYVEAPRNDFPLTCKSTPFYDRNVLLPNGDIVLCCMDYELKHIIGNLLEMDYEELFNTKQFRSLVSMNEEHGFNKCSICKSCENVKELH